MTVRKRSGPAAASAESRADGVGLDGGSKGVQPSPSTEDPPIIRPKLGQILGISAACIAPFVYLFFFHYEIDAELKRSVLINAAMSAGGFVAAVTLIPVASMYVLRRNLFGYDINKRGSPQGTIKVPESLGIVVGIVFLVVTILFQHFNFTSDSDVLIHNAMQIGRSSDPEYQQAHAFSIYLIQPLLATSLALLSYNCETLLLFFLPEVLNFLYSCPQLFKFVPCPRHRLPRFDPETGLLTGTKDMNLVNLFLNLFGKCTERSLCIRLLLFQAISCLCCFVLRHLLAGWYK